MWKFVKNGGRDLVNGQFKVSRTEVGVADSLEWRRVDSCGSLALSEPERHGRRRTGYQAGREMSSRGVVWCLDAVTKWAMTGQIGQLGTRACASWASEYWSGVE